MAKGSASALLVRKAKRDLESCEAYLHQHFAHPSGPIQISAKKHAKRHMRLLKAAIDHRDAAAITRQAAALSKIMIYLWALRQFRSQGEDS